VRRLLAIVLLALLPLQFSWAAVASYCVHGGHASSGHFGYRDHGHHVGASIDAGLAADLTTDASSISDVTGGVEGSQAPGAMHLDCGHCHGTCSVVLELPLGLPGALSNALPGASTSEAVSAHAPTRPERPQWLPRA
jgi:hypothetical protein